MQQAAPIQLPLPDTERFRLRRFVAERVLALGPDDGREVMLALDELRHGGELTRLAEGGYALTSRSVPPKRG